MDYLDALVYRWRWVFVPLVLGMIGAVSAAYYLPKQYRSSTLIMVESEKIPSNFIPQMSTVQPRDKMQTVQQEVYSRTRIEKIVDELNPYPELGQVSRAGVVEHIRSKISIRLRGGDAFTIEYTDQDPHRAQQIAARIASLFIEETTRERTRQVEGASAFIEAQLKQTRGELERQEASLRAYKERYMGMLPEQLTANLATLQRLQLEQQSVTEAIRGAKDRRALLERRYLDEAALIRLRAVAPDGTPQPELDSPHARLAQLKAEMASLRSRYTEQHPEVRHMALRIDKLEKYIATLPPPSADGTTPTSAIPVHLQGPLADLRSQIIAAALDVQKLERRLQEIGAEIGAYQRRVEAAPKVEEELQALLRDYKRLSDYYSSLLSTRLEANTAGAVEKQWRGQQFRILDPADFPESPVFPSKRLFLVYGALIGLGIGIGLAFLREFFDHSVKSARDLEGLLPEYPLLVGVPRVSARG
jgi:polysaccharide chain length determinant protein (PEP-CTERM system associated)